MNLEEYAAARKRVYCQVCVLFERRPDLRAEADAGRARQRPFSYNVIAGFLQDKAGEGDPRPKGSAVRMHYVDDHMKEN